MESDSPGSAPLPSHSIGDSISVVGLKLLAGRAGATGLGASEAVAPPYFDSDSPGRTNGAGDETC